MRTKARFHDIGLDLKSRNVKLTFLLDDVTPQEIEKLQDKDLLLEVKKYSPPKTNDQNAYMWTLLQAMADHVKDGSNRWDHYMRCIRDYGVFSYYPAQDEDIPNLQAVFRLVLDRGEIEITTPSGKQVTCHQMQCFKGTSCYTKEELSNFIDKIVAECKDAGIDTETPDEAAHMRSIA